MDYEILKESISVEELDQLLNKTSQPAFLIDLMSREDFAEAHIPGAVNIPVEELKDRVSEVSRIMSQHNGEVKVKSQPGTTEFEICFPI